ncbi:MAG: CotH kinase family protein [Oscillospiraceae bacterium]|nr:CotH kinase family protein [Oscillospiraceae bacterium]
MNAKRLLPPLLAALIILTLITPSALAEGGVLYPETVFSTDRVHVLDLTVDKAAWRLMTEKATEEIYVPCDVSYDGYTVKKAAIRPKGNSSLNAALLAGTDRFSFKIEFDHYEKSASLLGLDKLCLNNLGQDKTCLKDYMAYTMMRRAGVPAPLCAFVKVRLNGEDFGLCLAVEAVEDSFALRNYGPDHGNLYKPDSFSMEAVFSYAAGKFSQGQTAAEDMWGKMEAVITPARTPGDRADYVLHALAAVLYDAAGDLTVSAGAYAGEDPAAYAPIFDKAVFPLTRAQESSYISAVRELNTGDPFRAADAERVLSYLAVLGFTDNFDSLLTPIVHNFYFYEKDCRLSFVPWDFDLAFGGFTFEAFLDDVSTEGMSLDPVPEDDIGMDLNASKVNYPIYEPCYGVSIEERPLFGRLLATEEGMALYKRLYGEFITGFFDSGDFERVFDGARELIAPYVAEGLALHSTAEFDRAADNLRSYCLLRAESVRRQLAGTLPGTIRGQSEDWENLVDCGDLDLASTSDISAVFGQIEPEDVERLLRLISGKAEGVLTFTDMTDAAGRIIENPRDMLSALPDILGTPFVRAWLGRLRVRAAPYLQTLLAIGVLAVLLLVLKRKRK